MFNLYLFWIDNLLMFLVFALNYFLLLFVLFL